MSQIFLGPTEGLLEELGELSHLELDLLHLGAQIGILLPQILDLVLELLQDGGGI